MRASNVIAGAALTVLLEFILKFGTIWGAGWLVYYAINKLGC